MDIPTGQEVYNDFIVSEKQLDKLYAFINSMIKQDMVCKIVIHKQKMEEIKEVVKKHLRNPEGV